MERVFAYLGGGLALLLIVVIVVAGAFEFMATRNPDWWR